MEALGWIGGLALAFCALPQVITCYKTKSADGISSMFLGLWLFGEVATFIFTLPLMKYQLFFNYAINILFILIICYYKIRYRSDND